MNPRWICVQLGAREHYAIPRALLRRNSLAYLLTDAWLAPSSAMAIVNSGLAGRFHNELSGTSVQAWTLALLLFELRARVRGLSGWPQIVARNRWFQSCVASALGSLELPGHRTGEVGLFSYSYTALAPFRVAKRRGWRTILGQIDPGPQEERIVAGLCSRFPEYRGGWCPAPTEYWSDWREECLLADTILVNSEWSREALLAEGVPQDRLVILPLAYDAPLGREIAARRYPQTFSTQRPLRVLFLGQVILRKGIHDLLCAAEALKHEPVMFDVVGNYDFSLQALPQNVVFHGPVDRSKVSRWYEAADLFALPTHSDGFALTQLEAMAHGLPVLATANCAAIVQHAQTGWITAAGNPTQLAQAIRTALAAPNAMTDMSWAAIERSKDFATAKLSERLADLLPRAHS